MSTTTINWSKANASLRYYNGMRKSVVIGPLEWGVFKEKYGHAWSVAHRPVDGSKFWSRPIPFESMKEAVEFVEKIAEPKAAIAQAEGRAA